MVRAEPTREQQLLLLCARVQLGTAHRDRIRDLLALEVDCDRLTQAARHHGVVPLLARNLHEAGRDRCPRHVLGDLQSESRRVLEKSFRLVAELAELLELFRGNGIPAIPFKGPVAALAYYGDVGLRTFNDLDLLVPEATARDAWRLLVERGYEPQFALETGWQQVHIRTGSEHLFRHRESGGLVDLHWSLLPRGYTFTPTSEEPWQRRESVRVGGSEVETLAPEPMLLFLCLHGAKHDWSSLEWVCDVAELIRARPALDWDQVLAWSSTPGRRRLVDLGLHLAHRLLGASVPPQVLERSASDRELRAILNEAARNATAIGDIPVPTAWKRTVGSLFFRAMENPRDRLRFLHDTFLLPTPLEWEMLPLPPALAPLHYALRPVRLALKHAGLLGRR
jgi:hypothetical protein